MANTRSQLMADFISDPQVMSKIGEQHGRQRVKVARFTTVAGEGIGHIYRLCRMRAHDRLLSIMDVRAADAGMTGIDVGIRTPSKDTVDPVQISAAADQSLVDALSRAAAQATPVEILGTGKTLALLLGKPLWELAGIATEPVLGAEFELVMIPAGDPAGGGDTALVITYVAGD